MTWFMVIVVDIPRPYPTNSASELRRDGGDDAPHHSPTSQRRDEVLADRPPLLEGDADVREIGHVTARSSPRWPGSGPVGPWRSAAARVRTPSGWPGGAGR